MLLMSMRAVHASMGNHKILSISFMLYAKNMYYIYFFRSGKLTMKLPNTLHPTSENLASEGIYLINDSDSLWLYIGRAVQQTELEEHFLVPSHVRPSNISFNPSSPLAMKMEGIVNYLRQNCAYKQPLVVVWAELSTSRSIDYVKFTSRLVEDSIFGVQSYVDWLCKVHSKIRSLPK